VSKVKKEIKPSPNQVKNFILNPRRIDMPIRNSIAESAMPIPTEAELRNPI
jgi:hypothetical protein